MRRRAVGPSLHRKYLEAMLDRVFGESALHLNTKLAAAAQAGAAVNIEASFSQLTLDVIGKAVFNHDFGALDKDSPLIQAVYTALKETESRATDLLPIWKLPGASLVVPRHRRAAEAVSVIRTATEELIAQCKAMVDEEEQARASGAEEYINTEDPSILRFLIASRDEVSAVQLRDDLLGMLVAGHETTASVLTWTVYFLAQYPEQMAKLQVRAPGNWSNFAAAGGLPGMVQLPVSTRGSVHSLRVARALAILYLYQLGQLGEFQHDRVGDSQCAAAARNPCSRRQLCCCYSRGMAFRPASSVCRRR